MTTSEDRRARSNGMEEPGSVSQWLVAVKQGDQEAAARLWERYFQRLVALARRKLRASPRRAADEEDAVLSAFDSFYRGAKVGRFPRLADRNDLWQVLVMITARKAANQRKRELRAKRGAGRVRGDSVFYCRDSHEAVRTLDAIIGREPTPEFAASAAEEFSRLMDRLDDDLLRTIARWKMEGYTNQEIGAKLERQERTVERKLRVIRKVWTQTSSDE
jgi:DNA-directed RNA polymerase specialized sigma24 family protein